MVQSLEDEGALGSPNIPWESIFTRVLGSKDQITDDAQLPRTGLPLEWERVLSPVFLDPVPSSQGQYGTRSQTVLAVFSDGRAELQERTCLPEVRRILLSAASHVFGMLQLHVGLTRMDSRTRPLFPDPASMHMCCLIQSLRLQAA